MPLGQLGEIVGTHQQHKAGIGKQLPQGSNTIHRVARSQTRLDVAYPNAAMRMPRHMTRLRHSFRQRCTRLIFFERILRRDHPPDPIQLGLSKRAAADCDMTFMGGVKTSPQQSDPRARCYRGQVRGESAHSLAPDISS